jgi:hypothetical protein
MGAPAMVAQVPLGELLPEAFEFEMTDDMFRRLDLAENELSCEYVLHRFGFACRCHRARFLASDPQQHGLSSWSLIQVRRKDLLLEGIVNIEGRLVEFFLVPTTKTNSGL